MKINYTLLIATLLVAGEVKSQHLAEPCYFNNQLNQHWELAENAEFRIQEAMRNQSTSLKNVDTVKIIPVVVHVIHNGGIDNISDEQIKSQIKVLNEDYGKLTNTRGDGAGVDTRIRFCLAGLTPNGQCTDGIVRIQSSLSNHQTYQRSMLKELSFWDNKRYLNIYIVREINNGSGTLGYASFPGGPDAEDGIVIKHNAFGLGGTASGSSAYGRTASHEVGHWLGLYHTFQDGCGTDTCTSGDKVCDTPPVANPNFGCPTGVNSCSNDDPNMPDQITNYMDYSNDDCKSMFSNGQRLRMDASLQALRYEMWQPSNTLSTGCDTSVAAQDSCNVIANFTANGRSVCLGSTVQFTNSSVNKPMSFKWYFPGGNPNSSTDQNAVVNYDTLGDYDVQLISTNAYGNDTLLVNDFISVKEPSLGQSTGIDEDFEAELFPPLDIIIENPDNGVTWERTTKAGYKSLASVRINNLINTNYGQSDAIALPALDLTKYEGKNPTLEFNWAYARSDANYSDELMVLISTDCGLNFKQVFYRTGTGMATGTTQTSEYIPDSTTKWKFATIKLDNYTSFGNVILKIVNVTDGGNCLYIDDIKLGYTGGGLGIGEATMEDIVNIYPNPSTAETTLSIDLTQASSVGFIVYDVVGRNVYEMLPETLGIGVHQFNIPNNVTSSKGIYMVKLSIANKVEIIKLIKQ